MINKACYFQLDCVIKGVQCYKACMTFKQGIFHLDVNRPLANQCIEQYASTLLLINPVMFAEVKMHSRLLELLLG